MHSGSELIQTWIPTGGFRIERRKLKTPDGGSAIADCLVPKWTDDDLAPDHPCARQPCLHRIFAECPPDSERILDLAGRYGLLTVSIPRLPAPGETVRADALPPEPLEIWKREIQALRMCADLWDSGSRDRLARKLAEHFGPRPVPPSTVRRKTARLPLLPADTQRRAVAALRRRSRRSPSPRPLPGSQVRPLVPQGRHRPHRQALLLQRLQEPSLSAEPKILSGSLLFESFIDRATQRVPVGAHLVVPSALLLTPLIFVLNQVRKPIELE